MGKSLVSCFFETQCTDTTEIQAGLQGTSWAAAVLKHLHATLRHQTYEMHDKMAKYTNQYLL